MKPQLPQLLIPQHVFPGLRGGAERFEDQLGSLQPLRTACVLSGSWVNFPN